MSSRPSGYGQKKAMVILAPFHTYPGDDPHYMYDVDALPSKLENHPKHDGKSRAKALRACRDNKRAWLDAWICGEEEPED